MFKACPAALEPSGHIPRGRCHHRQQAGQVPTAIPAALPQQWLASLSKVVALLQGDEPARGLPAQQTFFLGRRCEFRMRRLSAVVEVVRMSSFAFCVHVLIGNLDLGGTPITGKL